MQSKSIERLRKQVQEWEQAAEEDGETLLTLQGCVGLVLYDVCRALGIPLGRVMSYASREEITGYVTNTGYRLSLDDMEEQP